jgi:DNA primase large subunit
MRKVSDLTVEEFEQLLEEVVERKLEEFLGDPDEGLELTEWIEERLRETNAALKAGVRGIPHEELLHRLKLGRSRQQTKVDGKGRGRK